MGLTTKNGKPESEWTNAQKVKQAKSNHLWLNAMKLVHPSDELLRDIGESIVNMVKGSEMVDDLSGTLKVVYIRVNAS